MKLTVDQLNAVLDRALDLYRAHMYRAHPTWRWGQCCFNALYDLHPDLADEIRATEFDPFYWDDDARLERFYERISDAVHDA